MGDDRPAIRVVRGQPTAEELAALVGVVLSRSAATTPAPPSSPGGWLRDSRARGVARGLPTYRGPHAWRGSAFPA